MPVNGYSVGRDVTLKVTLAGGQALTIPGLTSFDKKPDMSDQKIVRIDGNVDHLVFPGGWSGTFELDRQDATVDQLMANIESAYYSGQNQLSGTITETISEVNGSVTQWQYQAVMLKPTTMGQAQGDKSIKQTVQWMCSRRVKVG